MTSDEEIEQVTSELDRLAGSWASVHHRYLARQAAALLRRLRDERDEARARIEELEKALEPFAKAAEELIPGTPDEAGVMWDGIVAMANAGHLRTAARALGEG